MGEVNEYIVGLMKHFSMASVAYLTGLSQPKLYGIHTRLPNRYSDLQKIVDCCGGDEDELKRIINKNYSILYKYWDDMYPDCVGKRYVGKIIKRTIDDKSLRRKDFMKMSGIGQSRLSAIETCKVAAPYYALEVFSKFAGISIASIFDELRNASPECVGLTKLCKEIKNIRQDKKRSLLYISKKLDVQIDSYKFFEMGLKPIKREKYLLLEEELGLDPSIRKSLEAYNFLS